MRQCRRMAARDAAGADSSGVLCSLLNSRRWTAALTWRAASPPPKPRGAPTTGATGWSSTPGCSRARATRSGCLTSARTCSGLLPGSLVRLEDGEHRHLSQLQGLWGRTTVAAVRCCSQPGATCRGVMAVWNPSTAVLLDAVPAGRVRGAVFAFSAGWCLQRGVGVGTESLTRVCRAVAVTRTWLQ